MKAAGLCLGASNLSMVELNNSSGTIVMENVISRPHDGNVKKMLTDIWDTYHLANFDSIAVTGRKFKELVNFTSISEPEAIENSYNFLKDKYGEFDAIVSAGGETFILYLLNKKGTITSVITGNKCASGTGEFFLQQLKRMHLSIDEAMSIAENPPYKVAGRCSVFCKSDCTHAMNKGEAKGRIVSGLCKMMAIKILELVKKSKCEKVLLIGGTSKNRQMLHFLKQELKNLEVPEEASYFEALGTAIWALNNETKKIPDQDMIFHQEQNSFSFLPSLKEYIPHVTFKTTNFSIPEKGDQCIVGLDVGSTTTKAVIMKTDDHGVVASVYLRTNGDPIAASRQCYQRLLDQLSVPVDIVGLGVTGSGRQIAGLHALTDGVVNEIIAHAAAAYYFDPEVDTIFEIGGQDAKYTYITNGVASDYAMNEACSAGTGSFLEEAAMESMGIDYLDIEKIALKSDNPPNFNDQCAAFISSDIKTAVQEGISKEDITAGLVYSICQNYINRVKGNRQVGNKVFMQGGVCYNKAVPIAMASLTGREIIVPPEPGLMGAFGVALVIKQKIGLGLLKEKSFNLQELADRVVTYGNPIICNGGKERCDRKCSISTIIIDGKKYPFGGACNRFVNRLHDVQFEVEKLDLVARREKLIFEEYAQPRKHENNAKKIGISKSLMANSLYPLYDNFFTNLGLEVVLGDSPHNEGVENKNAAFCYPVELAHGYIYDLLNKNTDYIFLPQVREMYVKNGIEASVTCPFVQGEPYFLKSAFHELKNRKLITPVLDFAEGYKKMEDGFANLGKELGFSRKLSVQAYQSACESLENCYAEMQSIGRQVLDDLEKDPDKIVIVLFGRPYNAFTKVANMGIPHKFASRGVTIIPMDFLPFSEEDPVKQMYWSNGQVILKAAKLVEKHPQLFGAYITNFSCGPDSFIIGYFRDIMKQKPSLTLELDSHSADAGIDTRIEAFLDVVSSYVELQKKSSVVPQADSPFQIGETFFEAGTLHIIDSNGNTHSLTDKSIHVAVPSMGDIASRCLAAAFRYVGVNSSSLTPPAEAELKAGRANSACKECLPLTLTLGSLIEYLDKRKNPDEVLVYFMPETSGPCRFGQYNILMKNYLKKNKIPNVALMSLSSVNSYAGLGVKFQLRAWAAVVFSDVMDDIYSALLVLARDKKEALKIYHEVAEEIVSAFAVESWTNLKSVLRKVSQRLADIPKTGSLEDVKKVGLLGEIYVRRDDFSRQYLVERLAEKNIIVKTAPNTEWLYYTDYLVKKSLSHGKKKLKSKIGITLAAYFKRYYEKEIKLILSESGLYHFHMLDVDQIISRVQHLISPKLTGEAILTIGGALTEIIDDVSGIIAIGPFGCMPNRISEAIISDSINSEKINTTSFKEIVEKILEDHPALPFLAIESDGNVFPQVIEARLEAFYLQVDRLHHSIKKAMGKSF